MSTKLVEDLFDSELSNDGRDVKFECTYFLLDRDLGVGNLVMVRWRPDHGVRVVTQVALAQRRVLLYFGARQYEGCGAVRL